MSTGEGRTCRAGHAPPNTRLLLAEEGSMVSSSSSRAAGGARDLARVIV
ncbi:MAG: hypothetical protein JRD84_10780 [Deltaproteobacteria bacterium]|nr:hypothetical protein [Deltaproteobacteria bacterium]